MKLVLVILFFTLSYSQAFGANLTIELSIKNNEPMFWSTRVVLTDSAGNNIAFAEVKDTTLVVVFPDSIAGKITIRIEAYGYFPIEIDCYKARDVEKITLSDVLLVSNMCVKLPKGATCGTHAPLKKDIPHKMIVLMNGSKQKLVANTREVVGVTYISRKTIPLRCNGSS